ncbi:DUF5667 domain-containing protein [Salinibacillus xinjiangensis]|uniref:DUF5667 domain-containing protein n=1 Tax=Salinibacillus xinjiangensis TaxID=1229268 RepID=A0A6G1X7L2_9BACI|nr:DUF5667 domain-containing protein [Salinibacillus xinjiangensis]MRG86896.1 hypothetical protein [Salinibacillus xinjiangensis]
MKGNTYLKVIVVSALIFSLLNPLTIFAEEDKDQVELNTNELSSLTLFDFFKSFTNHLQLALADNETGKAEVLVEMSEEIISKAERLLADGKQEKAGELLQKAADMMAQAEKLGANVETDVVEADAKESEKEEEVEVVELDDTFYPEEEDEKETQSSNLHAKIGQNVIALTLAMEKVKNPVAKKALQRNIEKSLARLKVKYGNIVGLEEKLDQLSTDSTEDETETDMEDRDKDMVKKEEQSRNEGESTVKLIDQFDDFKKKGKQKDNGKKKGHDKRNKHKGKNKHPWKNK